MNKQFLLVSEISVDVGYYVENAMLCCKLCWYDIESCSQLVSFMATAFELIICELCHSLFH